MKNYVILLFMLYLAGSGCATQKHRIELMDVTPRPQENKPAKREDRKINCLLRLYSQDIDQKLASQFCKEVIP